MAVEVAKLANLIAATNDITEANLKTLAQKCVAECKDLVGIWSTEDIVRFQKRYKRDRRTNLKPEPIMILDLVNKPNQYDIIAHYPGSTFETSRSQIIKECRQEVDGRMFLVCSIFKRGAPQTADEKLRALVERETEKDCRSTIQR